MRKTNIVPDELSDYFENIKSNLQFKQWYVGHFHSDIKIVEKETLLYNTVEKIY
ncbi:hypothetical protein I6N90_07675 [Paenibacillus sp. GSMTC-2017]|uniref:hypothetical protein n=1 Tax=Paenibacillus sp. GSMTC-2017 TaxID=2794350 RepID=UPI0018D8D2AD|nr:hypothetical protein [Paenibacillus sp. GSMTC-2017]MBH5317679.1 hypothetical protein [Paenibacillus sp. GSMTC-2017]